MVLHNELSHLVALGLPSPPLVFISRQIIFIVGIASGIVAGSLLVVVGVVFIAFDSLDLEVLKKVITLSEPFIYLDDMDYAMELNFTSTDKTVLSKVYDLLSSICSGKYLVKNSHYIGLRWEL